MSVHGNNAGAILMYGIKKKCHDMTWAGGFIDTCQCIYVFAYIHIHSIYMFTIAFCLQDKSKVTDTSETTVLRAFSVRPLDAPGASSCFLLVRLSGQKVGPGGGRRAAVLSSSGLLQTAPTSFRGRTLLSLHEASSHSCRVP